MSGNETHLKPQEIETPEQEKIARDILIHPDKTLPGLMFLTIGRIIYWLTHFKRWRGEREPYPWYFNVIALALVVQLPTLLLAIVYKEKAQMQVLGPIWMVYIELGLSATILAYLDVDYLYKNLDKYILRTIDRERDLDDLGQILSRASSVKHALYFMFFFTPFWCVAFSWANTVFLGQFIGIGLTVGTIVFGILVSPALYMLGWVFLLTRHLGSYVYELNDTSPAHSEVIQRLSNIFSSLLYSIAVFIAFATLTVANNLYSVFLAILIGWAPLTVYFINSQIAISKIITNAKWKTLARIQNQIKELNAGNLADPKKLEAINALMSFYDRVRATPNSTFSVGTGLNFFSQLALPLLGLLLANIDSLVLNIEKLVEAFSGK